jgi:elongation factor Ts
MNITADAVKQLRERTGAGMMECKKALVETKGDLDAAADLMRKQGLAKADKKASRIAAEGVIVIDKSADGRSGAMLEVNCETDFVAREADFKGFAQAVVAAAAAKRPASLDDLLAIKLDSGETVDERRRVLVAKIGENISVRRFTLLSAPAQLGAYVHGTRIGALVALEGGDASVAYDIAMHVAASNPRYLDVASIPAEIVAKERGILGEQAQNEAQTSGKPKPADIIAKMVEGRLRKNLGEITLLGQAFVKDPDVTIEKLLGTAKAKVVGYERYEVGAGIEKKQEDFADEVRRQVESARKSTDGADQSGGPKVTH